MTVQLFATPGERAGLALIAVAGLASAMFTGGLLSYIVWNSFIVRRTKQSPVPYAVRSFARSSLGCYLLSLLICDFCQGIAFALNFYWMRVGSMSNGTICTVQGAVSQLGDLGSTVWSLAIALHTFWLLFLTRKPHYLVAPVALCTVWAILIILPIVGPLVIQNQKRGSFYDISGAWCWIGTSYGTARVLYLYAWIFTTLAISIVAYGLIYLRFSNIIIVEETGKLAINWGLSKSTPAISISQPGASTSRYTIPSQPGCFSWAKDIRNSTAISSRTPNTNSSDGLTQTHVGDHLKRTARRLMWYPILYAIVVLPPSICRMGVLAGWEPPFGLFVFAGICFGSSGITNSVLFITTRHSFIKKVAQKSTTRVHVTTQRITIREEWTDAEQEVELGALKLERASYSPTSPNSPKTPTFYPDIIDAAAYGDSRKRVSVLDHRELDDRNQAPAENQAGFHVTVFENP